MTMNPVKAALRRAALLALLSAASVSLLLASVGSGSGPGDRGTVVNSEGEPLRVPPSDARPISLASLPPAFSETLSCSCPSLNARRVGRFYTYRTKVLESVSVQEGAYPLGFPDARLPASRSAEPVVKTGLEVFLEGRLDLVKGKRVGLIVNPTGVDSRLRSTVELLKGAAGVKLVALYGPEHGARGDAQAGAYVPFYFDQKFQLPVFSLYGQSFKPEPGMLKNIDSYMRARDTDASGRGKIPESAMIKDVDVLIYDIQEVGTRVYTYVATMAYAMEAAAEGGIDFIVLDRPNPINGIDLEGPVLDYPEQSSFVGLYPIPQRYGMTIGELALLFNTKFLKKKANLTVIPMAGWRRGMWFDETGLPWVSPSPNMPTLETATVYPGQVLLEGTNVSEGRGTTRPFELCGAPWIDGYELARRLNALGLEGVLFREAWFTPTFSKFAGELCGGVQVHVTDRNRYRSFGAALHLIQLIRDMYPDKFEFHADYFDKVTGTARIRKALEQSTPVDEIVRSYEKSLKDFADLRQPCLLYQKEMSHVRS